MNKLSLFNIAAIVVPFACFLIAGGVIYREVLRINQLNDTRIQMEKNIAFLETIQKELDRQPPLPRFPTVEQSPREQPDFLNTLRMFAFATSVRLVRYTNATPIAPSSTSAANQDTKPASPSGVIPIASSVEVAGRYTNIREFLYALQRSPRLFNMSDIRWTASAERWPITSTSFTLTRYVTAAKTAAGPASPGEPPTGIAQDTNLITSPGRRLGPSAPSTLPTETR